jgi:uncharacterized protein (TIGR02996 family)
MVTESESEDRRYIQNVVANPDDDAPRLEFANWLEKQGQGERAEFIRLQCEIAEKQQREKELLHRNWTAWTKDIHSYGAEGVKFHRGFPEQFSMSPGRFLLLNEGLNSLTPIRQLDLSFTTDETLIAIAALPVFRQVRALGIGSASVGPNGPHFGPDGIRALATSEFFSGLQQLTLRSHNIGDSGAKIIASSPHLQNLTHLSLDDPILSRSATTPDHVIGSPNMARLQYLKLGKTEHGSHELQTRRSVLQSGSPEGRGRG